MRTKYFLISSLLLNLIVAPAAFCDGMESGDQQVPAPRSGTGTSAELGDKRLPAVMPGQEVEAHGRKMNVWTTSGPVPVAQPPEPWKKDSEQIKVNANGIGVVVDQRRPANEPSQGQTR